MWKLLSFMGTLLLTVAVISPVAAQHQDLTPFEQKKQEINEITVSIVVSGMRCTCARFAEDIRNVVNDLGTDGVRVLPVLGVGGIQNLQDVLFLKGIDMGTVDQDHIEYLENKNPSLYANLRNQVRFVTKLYNSEFHIAARNEFTRIADLQGKRVSFNLENSHTHIAAEILFGMAGIETVKSYMDNDQALQKLKDGTLDAHFVLTGAPQSGLSKLTAEDGIHLLPLTEGDLPAANKPKLYSRYLPADLTSEHYPELIAPGETVPTIATRTALAVYNWQEGSYRYRKLERFIQVFFSKIGKFRDKSRHPKWAEVNLEAEIPGWQRFKPAQEWLDGNRDKRLTVTAAGDPSNDVRADFESFLSHYRQSNGQVQLSSRDREQLFDQFKQFLAYRKAQAEN